MDFSKETPHGRMRDQLALNFLEYARSRAPTPTRFNGMLLAMDVANNMVNYTTADMRYWHPHESPGAPRRMISLGDDVPGLTFPIFGVDALRLGCTFAMRYRGSKSQNTEDLFHIPYIHFREPSTIDTSVGEVAKGFGIQSVDFIIMNEGQFQSLVNLVGTEILPTVGSSQPAPLLKYSAGEDSSA